MQGTRNPWATLGDAYAVRSFAASLIRTNTSSNLVERLSAMAVACLQWELWGEKCPESVLFRNENRRKPLVLKGCGG